MVLTFNFCFLSYNIGTSMGSGTVSWVYVVSISTKLQHVALIFEAVNAGFLKGFFPQNRLKS